MGRVELIRKLRESHREIEPGQDISIGLFRPEDAPGIAQAYYETYGDSFPLEHVYAPEEITRRNALEDQYTLVARTPKGDVVGLCGLFRHAAPNPGVCEAGQYMVLESYRKRDIGKDLSKVLYNSVAKHLQIPAVFCEAVTNRTLSQYLAEIQGLVYTGLEVECMPPRTDAIEGGISRNVSLLFMFRTYENVTCNVHIPEVYRTFCDAVYADLMLNRVSSPSAALPGDTLASQSFQQEIGLLRLTVTRSGRDFGETVSAAEAKAGSRGIVQILLNLGDATAPKALALLRNRGYFLGGLLPFWFDSDGLLMQKVCLEPDWDAIQVSGPKAAAIRDMVREDFERVKWHRSA